MHLQVALGPLRALCALVLVGTALPAAAAAHDCPEPALILDKAESSVVEGRFDDADQLGAEAEAAFACGPLAEAEQLARLLNVTAVRLHLDGDTAGAAEAFAAAARVSPTTWNEAYGAELRGVRDTAAAAGRGAGGTLTLEPEPGDFKPALDGVEVTVPSPAASGLHLLQVLDTDGRALYGELVFVPAGETLLVDTGPLVTRVGPRDRRPFPWLLVGAGVFAAGGGASAWLATQQTESIEGARTLDGLEGAYRAQKTWTLLTWTGAGLSGASVALHFAL